MHSKFRSLEDKAQKSNTLIKELKWINQDFLKAIRKRGNLQLWNRLEVQLINTIKTSHKTFLEKTLFSQIFRLIKKGPKGFLCN